MFNFSVILEGDWAKLGSNLYDVIIERPFTCFHFCCFSSFCFGKLSCNDDQAQVDHEERSNLKLKKKLKFLILNDTMWHLSPTLTFSDSWSYIESTASIECWNFFWHRVTELTRLRQNPLCKLDQANLTVANWPS